MGAWFASIIALVITYLFRAALSSAVQWVLLKWSEYRASQASEKRNEENVKKVEGSQSDEERRRNAENLLNND